mgnify:CR=1 FL=1|jgi:hypothetical protein
MSLLSIARPASLSRWFWSLLAANFLFIIAAKLLLQPFTPGEIVRFELAKEVPVAENILREWITHGKYNMAVMSIYLDFLFIILYTMGLGVTCIFLAGLTGHEILQRAGKFFASLLIVAGICDAIENFAMLRSMHGTIHRWSVILTYDMATTKFSIVLLTVLFIFVCLVFRLLRKL